MDTVASRDLRNHTADVLRKVADGSSVAVTVNGRVVAEITPARTSRPRYVTKSELVELLSGRQADAGLTRDLERLVGELTDDLSSP